MNSQQVSTQKMQQNEPILHVSNLTKYYGEMLALDKLSFDLYRGQIMGLLGPNGAGKTTAIRIITTIYDASSGVFTLNGISHSEKTEIRQSIGVLPESHGFPGRMSGLSYLTYFGQLYGLSKTEAKIRARKLLSEVGLKKRMGGIIGKYSRGMRQRLGIARAIINDPPVLFLDEPTLGLDPKGQQELLELIKVIAKERDTAVILCSHLLSDIEQICDEVLILKQGKKVAQGSVSDIIGSKKHTTFRFTIPEDKYQDIEEKIRDDEKFSHLKRVNDAKGEFEIDLRSLSGDHGSVSIHLMKILSENEIPLLHFELTGSRLHDVFLELTEGTI